MLDCKLPRKTYTMFPNTDMLITLKHTKAFCTIK